MARSRIHRFSSFSRPKERRKKHQFVKLLYPTTFSVVQFVNYTANQDFHFVSLFSNFFIHIFLRLCRTRPESLICTNFCLRFRFYDRKMNTYIFVGGCAVHGSKIFCQKKKEIVKMLETWRFMPKNKLFVISASFLNHRCTYSSRLNETLAFCTAQNI